MRQLQQGLDDAMDIVMSEPRVDDGDDGSSVTLTITVTLSETEDSDSMSYQIQCLVAYRVRTLSLYRTAPCP